MNQQTNKPGVVNIRGKEYKTVALRVQEFHEDKANAELAIVTKIIRLDDMCAVVEAAIMDKNCRVLANGHAEEFRGSGPVNRTSALENAETSAIGRALACFGLGGTEFASADEVQRAMSQQSQKCPPEKVAALQAYMDQGLLKPEHLMARFGHTNVSELLEIEADKIINGILLLMQSAPQPEGEQ